MSDNTQTAAALLSAMLIGASPTASAVQGQTNSAAEVSPMAKQVPLGPTVSTVDNRETSIESVLGRTLPQGSLDGTYFQCAGLSNVPSSRTRQLVIEQMAEQADALYAEHSELVDRSFSQGLSSREQRRLDLVRWSLHQIQDARQGEQLDLLGQRAREYSAFAVEVANLKAEILDKLPKRGRKTKA